MKIVEIECEIITDIRCITNNDVRVSVGNPHLGFIRELSDDEIVLNCDSDVSLFRRLLENDDVQSDLHEYLRESGYIYNKG